MRTHVFQGASTRISLGADYDAAAHRAGTRERTRANPPIVQLFSTAVDDQIITPRRAKEKTGVLAQEKSLSRDIPRLRRMKRWLALYRIVFGQPRQEDLIAYLDQAMPEDIEQMEDWQISLLPPEGANGCDRRAADDGNH